jgi:hypothetical protein
MTGDMLLAAAVYAPILALAIWLIVKGDPK